MIVSIGVVDRPPFCRRDWFASPFPRPFPPRRRRFRGGSAIFGSFVAACSAPLPDGFRVSPTRGFRGADARLIEGSAGSERLVGEVAGISALSDRARVRRRPELDLLSAVGWVESVRVRLRVGVLAGLGSFPSFEL